MVEALATASSTILMQHITPERMVKRISWALIGFVGAWMLAAVVCCAVSSSVAAILDVSSVACYLYITINADDRVETDVDRVWRDRCVNTAYFARLVLMAGLAS